MCTAVSLEAPLDNILAEATNLNQKEMLKNNTNVAAELHGISLSKPIRSNYSGNIYLKAILLGNSVINLVK